MTKFADLDYERQQWIAANYYTMGILIEVVSKTTDTPFNVCVEAYNKIANDFLDVVPPEHIKKVITELDNQNDGRKFNNA